jgi:hypothetical protein
MEWNSKYVLLFGSTSEHSQAVCNWSNMQFPLLLIVCNESFVTLFVTTEFCKEQPNAVFVNAPFFKRAVLQCK